MLCFVDEGNDFKLNTVLHREPVYLMEDGADVLPGPDAGENSYLHIVHLDIHFVHIVVGLVALLRHERVGHCISLIWML